MCRNIRVLHHFQPPTTKDEMRAAALQYVRKVSGTTKKPPAVDEATFARAVDEVARATEKLLAELHAPKAPARTREGEKEKAKARWKKRETRIQSS
jgi:hypothetical protein